jgi:hypothetical protein
MKKYNPNASPNNALQIGQDVDICGYSCAGTEGALQTQRNCYYSLIFNQRPNPSSNVEVCTGFLAVRIGSDVFAFGQTIQTNTPANLDLLVSKVNGILQMQGYSNVVNWRFTNKGEVELFTGLTGVPLVQLFDTQKIYFDFFQVCENGTAIPPQTVTKKSVLFTNLAQEIYLGAQANLLPAVWVRDIQNGVTVANERAVSYIFTLFSFRVNFIEQLTGPTTVEIPFPALGYGFAKSKADQKAANQTLSDWLNTIPEVIASGTRFEDNGGLIYRGDAHVDFLVKCQYRHIGGIRNWFNNIRIGISSRFGYGVDNTDTAANFGDIVGPISQGISYNIR